MHAPAAGFADPVADTQSVFRTLMAAMAEPAQARPLARLLDPPAPLVPGLAAVALALVDQDTPLWLSPELAASEAVLGFLRFHTAVRITDDPAAAAFALAASLDALPPLAAFAQGTDAYPDRSTTVVAAVDVLAAGGPLRFSGPGIRGEAMARIEPWPGRVAADLVANRKNFPRGVDLVLVSPAAIMALPRTTEPVGGG